MKLPPHLLDRWLQKKEDLGSRIRWDLASSTGPRLTLRELVHLTGADDMFERLASTELSYTPASGIPELRAAIAEREGVSSDDVIVVTGASEAFLILFALAAEHRANVVLPWPDFPAMTAVASGLGLEVRPYRMDPTRNFRVDPEEITSLIDRNTKLVTIISPHNPTGVVTDASTLREVHDFCVKQGVELVCDQVYHPVYHGAVLPSAASLPGVTIMGDCSKALCLSGLRIGWIVQRDAARREQFLNARMYFTISNAILNETLATLALRHRDVIVRQAQDVASRNLGQLEAFFQNYDDTFGWVRPGGGFTCFPWLREATDATPLCFDLEQHGVLVAPGSCFGAPAHFRLGFGASGDSFGEGLERMAAIVRARHAAV